jgi:hypothetical protein
MSFPKHLFETVSFIRSMPYTSFQRSQALEGGVKELIIEIQRNFFEYRILYSSLVCLGLSYCCINLFPLHFWQAVLLLIKVLKKLVGSTDLQHFLI